MTKYCTRYAFEISLASHTCWLVVSLQIDFLEELIEDDMVAASMIPDVSTASAQLIIVMDTF